MNVQEKKTVEYCIGALSQKLCDLVGNFAGKKARLELLDQINTQFAGSKLAGLVGNDFSVSIKRPDWSAISEVIEKTIASAANIVGRKTVEKEIRTAMKEIESDLSANLFEEYFRLNLHHYLD